MNAIARFNRSIWIAQLGVISVIAAATTAQQARFTVREIVTQPRGWGSTWHAKLLDDGTVVRSGSRDGVAVAQIGSAEPIEFPSFSTAWQWQANPLSVDHFFTLSGSPAGKAIARVTTVGTVVISPVPDLSAVSVQCVRADGWPVATWALPSPDAIGASVAFNEREVEELQAPAGVDSYKIYQIAPNGDEIARSFTSGSYVQYVRYNRASGAPPIALRIDGATSSYLTVGRFNRQGHALAAELISPKPGILVGTTVMPFAPEGSPIPYLLNDVEQATVRAGKGSNEPGLMEHGVAASLLNDIDGLPSGTIQWGDAASLTNRGEILWRVTIDGAAKYLVLTPTSTIPGDVDRDGVVGGYDLEALIALWGTDSPAADVNEDATVDSRDLAMLLANWSL